MTQLRALGALLLIVLGAAFASLALSGYYAPGRLPPGGSHQTAAGEAAPVLQATPIGWKSRQRFVASNEQSAPTPAKSAAATKPKPAAKPPAKKAVAVVKEKRQAAVPWPWSLFSN